jgi:hypothetical protein
VQTSLIGDLIMGIREQATDLPRYLPPLSAITASFFGSGTIPAGATVWVVVTQLTPWGESAPSAEQSFVNTSGGAATMFVSGTVSYAAIGVRIYFTTLGAGLEDRYIFFPFASPSGAFSAVPVGSPSPLPIVGYPPIRSSAWLPDTDGTSLGVSSIYRWINEGLDAATAICDGIQDITGIPSVSGQAQYTMIGNWKKMSNGFYDGYPFAFGNKYDVFRHSNVVGITGTMVLNKNAETMMVEVWPQANRTAGTGTLSGAITPASTSLSYTVGATTFVLGFGLALLGPYPVDPSLCELVYYSGTGSGSQLVELTRGVGGTTPAAWPVGTQVSELNLYMSGTRLPQHYTVGQSALTLPLPPAWIDAIRTYLRARFKGAEQDAQGEQGLLKQFESQCQNIRGTRPVMGPRQIQIGGTGGVEVAVGAGSYFGGVILP